MKVPISEATPAKPAPPPPLLPPFWLDSASWKNMEAMSSSGLDSSSLAIDGPSGWRHSRQAKSRARLTYILLQELSQSHT